MATILPVPFLQFIDANGTRLAGSKLYIYAAGITNPIAPYKSAINNLGV